VSLKFASLSNFQGDGENIMNEAVNICVAGIIGVLVGIAGLYLTVRISSVVLDKIENKRSQNG